MHDVRRCHARPVIVSAYDIYGVAERTINFNVRQVRKIRCALEDVRRNRFQHSERDRAAVRDCAIESEIFPQMVLDQMNPAGVKVLEILMNEKAIDLQMWIKTSHNLTYEFFIFHGVDEQALFGEDRGKGDPAQTSPAEAEEIAAVEQPAPGMRSR